jgi:hypothetical protein
MGLLFCGGYRSASSEMRCSRISPEQSFLQTVELLLQGDFSTKKESREPEVMTMLCLNKDLRVRTGSTDHGVFNSNFPQVSENGRNSLV